MSTTEASPARTTEAPDAPLRRRLDRHFLACTALAGALAMGNVYDAEAEIIYSGLLGPGGGGIVITPRTDTGTITPYGMPTMVSIYPVMWIDFNAATVGGNPTMASAGIVLAGMHNTISGPTTLSMVPATMQIPGASNFDLALFNSMFGSPNNGITGLRGGIPTIRTLGSVIGYYYSMSLMLPQNNGFVNYLAGGGGPIDLLPGHMGTNTPLNCIDSSDAFQSLLPTARTFYMAAATVSMTPPVSNNLGPWGIATAGYRASIASKTAPFTGFAGFRFAGNAPLDSMGFRQFYYGWMRIRFDPFAFNTTSMGGFALGMAATLIDYAWENVVGTPIKTIVPTGNPVPEPGAFALACLGAGAAGWSAWRNRRRREDESAETSESAA